MRRRAAHLRALCVLALAAGTAPSPGDGPVSAAAGGSRERAPPTVIAVDAHDVVPGGHDSTRALRVLLEGLTRQRRRTRAGASVHLVFRNGVYHFWPHHAHEEHVLYVANNDEGRRRIALCVELYVAAAMRSCAALASLLHTSRPGLLPQPPLYGRASALPDVR